MTPQELKKRLTTNDIKRIMKSVGGVIFDEDDENIIYYTNVCHGGKSPKLYYVKNGGKNGYFYCFSECHGSVDIISIVENCNSVEMPEAIKYICDIAGIREGIQYGFTNDTIPLITDWDFINDFEQRKELFKDEENQLNIIPEYKMNMFQSIYMTDWINEGISVDTMKAFNIKYSTLNQSIVIPHYDIDNNLIGIRQRRMIEEDAEEYGKYTPVWIGNESFKHPLGLNLYGLNVCRDTIKKKKKVVLVEAEKSVLKAYDMFGENSYVVALCGSTIKDYQIKLLKDLDVSEVTIALDRQYDKDEKEYKAWIEHTKKIIQKLQPYFKVNVIWDSFQNGLLNYKDSPLDCGKDVFIKLYKTKIHMNNIY